MPIKHFLRPAIAMIELIFAIVVIGITLLSAPLVMNQSIQSSIVAMQQESIAAAATQISLILTQNWDENDSNATTTYGILNVAGGDASLSNGTRDLNATYSSRSFVTDPLYLNATTFANFGLVEVQDLNNFDDIDDFHGQTRLLRLYATETENLSNNKGEYLDSTIRMTDTVNYGVDTLIPNGTNTSFRLNNPFTTSPNSTNIKLITVTLTSASGETEHNKSIVMSAFSCNIGSAPLIPLVMN